MSGNLPPYDLELRAAEERRRLHSSVEELRERVREKLDIKKNARQHVVAGSAVAAIAALLLGYGFAGMFTRY